MEKEKSCVGIIYFYYISIRRFHIEWLFFFLFNKNNFSHLWNLMRIDLIASGAVINAFSSERYPNVIKSKVELGI